MIRTDSYLSCAEANHTLLHRALMISRNQFQINTGLKFDTSRRNKLDFLENTTTFACSSISYKTNPKGKVVKDCNLIAVKILKPRTLNAKQYTV